MATSAASLETETMRSALRQKTGKETPCVQAIQKIIVLREGNPICAVHYQDRARARQQRHGVFEIHDDIASMLARGPRHKHLVEKHAAFGRELYRHDVRILSELVRRLAIAQKQNVAVAAIELEQGAQQAARVLADAANVVPAPQHDSHIHRASPDGAS